MSNRKVIVSDANETLYELDFAPVVLPSHDDAAERCLNGLGSELDRFIFEQEPAGDIGDAFRETLAAAINECLEKRLTKKTEV